MSGHSGHSDHDEERDVVSGRDGFEPVALGQALGLMPGVIPPRAYGRIVNVIRALVIMSMNRQSASLTLKMSDGVLTDRIGVSDFTMNVAHLGADGVRDDNVDVMVKTLVESAMSKEGASKGR